MQNFEALQRELLRGGRGAGLEALAGSAEGQKLAAMLDGEKLQKAAQSGDTQALRAMLGSVLGTDEGRRLAANIRKLMEK